MLRKLLIGTMLSTAMTAGFAAPVLAADEVEVLHWWTSGGEAAALDVLKKNLESQGVTWKDMPVAGGGGEAAMTALRARVTAGDPPTAVQALGFDITDWAKQGVVGDLGEVATRKAGTRSSRRRCRQFAKYDGKWIAAPVNVHSTNWVWINKKALDAAGGKAPETWDELIAVLDKMKANGISPIGHGGQAWQDATIFDAVVLSLGTDFYKASMIDLDPAALGGDKMVEAFDRMAQAPHLCRRQLLRPRLEPRLGHGHRRQGRHADHGRLGQGRIPQGRPEAGHGFRLHPLPGHAGRRSPSTPTSS